MICKHFLKITFLNEPELFFAHSEMVSSIAIKQSQFNTSHLFAHIVCSIQPIDRTLSGSTAPSQSGPGGKNEAMKGYSTFPSITRASSSDCLMSYQDTHLVVGSLTPLQKCSWCILQPQATGFYKCVWVHITIISWNTLTKSYPSA